MPFAVLLTDDAVKDLEEIVEYVERHDVPGRADHVLDQLQGAIGRLAEHPSRGARPRELQSLGIKEYREVFFKPYRVIYRVGEDTVYVMLIVDGRLLFVTLDGRRSSDYLGHCQRSGRTARRGFFGPRRAVCLGGGG
jgi:toxin ParE1/3/4